MLGKRVAPYNIDLYKSMIFLSFATAVLSLHASFGCKERTPSMPVSTKQAGAIECKPDGSVLQLCLRLSSNSGANEVVFCEDIKNLCDHQVCFALRGRNRQIFQIAAGRIVAGKREWEYFAAPRNLSLGGVDAETQVRVVTGFSSGGGSAEGGETVEPSKTITCRRERFGVLRAGLYRLQSEWSLDILDQREAPNYRVLGRLVLKSNILDIVVENDIQGDQFLGRPENGPENGTGKRDRK
jgi:hypothetical protein